MKKRCIAIASAFLIGIMISSNVMAETVSDNSFIDSDSDSISCLVNYDDVQILDSYPGDELTTEAIDGSTISNAKIVNNRSTFELLWTSSNYRNDCYHKVVMQSAGILTLVATKPHDASNKVGKIDIIVYDENLKWVGESGTYYSCDNASNIYQYHIGLPAGTYYVNIKPNFSVTTGSIYMSYTFEMEDSNTCELEPNENAGYPTPMQLNKMYTGYYGSDGNGDNADFWEVDMVAGETYKIYISPFEIISPTTTLINVFLDGGEVEEITSSMLAKPVLDEKGQQYYEYTAKETAKCFISFFNYHQTQYEYKLGVYNSNMVAVDTTQIKEFVKRLYKVCLDRDPDQDGLNYWVDLLASEKSTGAEAAYGFIFSKEFCNKNLCNDDYIKQLYKAFMGREYDVDGLAYWNEQLENGKTREEVFNGFSQSDEFKNLCSKYGIVLGTPISIPQYGTIPTGECSICGKESGVTTFVKRMYKVCLDRDAELDGLNYWCNDLWNHTKTGREVAFGFIFSEEFKAHNYNDSDYVEHLYSAFFGRHSDSEGKNYWLGQLSSGKTREEVFNGFVGSKEFSQLCSKYGIKRD